jgi:hypothetical protein
MMDDEDLADRPQIHVEPGERDRMVNAAIEALHADPNLYERTGALAFITKTTEADRDRFPFLELGAPAVHLMSAPNLGQRLSRFATWLRRSAGDGGARWVPADPPNAVVQAVLAARQWPGIRPLAGIVEAPTLRPDGSVLDVPGYDARTGFLYAPSGPFPAIPAAPSRSDAAAAWTRLEDVFADFPFETPGDRAVAVAAVLTLIARPAIEGCVPVFAFDAANMGTGKSLAVDAVHTIATGRAAAKASFPTDRRGRNDEVRKMLDSAAIVGARALVFDNIAAGLEFGGSAIEQIVTTGYHQGRVLGRSELFSVRWTAVMFATGNNLSVAPEMPRRTLHARMVSHEERPEERPLDTYQHPDRAGRLLEWIRGERPRLVHESLTLLRAFDRAGRPRGAKCLGSFEAWSAFIAGAIVWAGGCDPAAQVMSAADVGESPQRAALRVLLRDLPRLDRGRGVAIRDIMAHLYPPERIRDAQVPPDGFDDLRQALEDLAPPKRLGAPPDSRELGHAFKAQRDRIVGGRRLQNPRNVHWRPIETRDGSVRWQVVDKDGHALRAD